MSAGAYPTIDQMNIPFPSQPSSQPSGTPPPYAASPPPYLSPHPGGSSMALRADQVPQTLAPSQRPVMQQPIPPPSFDPSPQGYPRGHPSQQYPSTVFRHPAAPPPVFTAAPVQPKGRPLPKPGGPVNMYMLVMLVGVLTGLCMVGLPIFGAISLLMDENYIFWQGYQTPLILIFVPLVILLLLVSTLGCLYRRAPHEQLNEYTMAVVGSVFSALLGVALVITSLHSAAGLNATSAQLMQGCSNTMQQSTILVNYDMVLTNLRSKPECALQMSVESCQGWAENKYTSYIRYMEQEFKCGSMCPSLGNIEAGPGESFSHEAWSPAALPQLKGRGGHHKGGGRHRELRQGPDTTLTDKKPYTNGAASGQLGGRVGNQAEVDEGQTIPHIADGAKMPLPVSELPAAAAAPPWFPAPPVAKEVALPRPMLAGIPGAASGHYPKLFGRGETRMFCYPIVATRLNVLAFYSDELLFAQGCTLIVVSLIVSVISFLGLCCCEPRFKD